MSGVAGSVLPFALVKLVILPHQFSLQIRNQPPQEQLHGYPRC